MFSYPEPAGGLLFVPNGVYYDMETHGEADLRHPFSVSDRKPAAVAERYRLQDEFLAAVKRGDEDVTLNFPLVRTTSSLRLNRNPDILRDTKNTLIVFNTTLRITVGTLGIEPYLIDAISERWGLKIERETSLEVLDAYTTEMVSDYTHLVKTWRLSDRSPLVRKTLQ